MLMINKLVNKKFVKFAKFGNCKDREMAYVQGRNFKFWVPLQKHHIGPAPATS